MPALVEHDIEAFGRALTAVDQRTGKYFTSSQGGLYSHRETTALIAEMLRLGAHGAGQSSWGPAVYAVAHASDAPALRAATRDFLLERGWGDDVLVCHGRNTGARVQIEAEKL
jgi:predicted sugar kinase